MSTLRAAELYEALLEAHSKLGQGVALVDLETGKVLLANDALARMAGYTVDEVLSLDSFLAATAPVALEPMDQSRRRRLEGSEQEAEGAEASSE